MTLSRLFRNKDEPINTFQKRKRRPMKKLIERFSDLVKGSIAGFDRIVFKGFILPLMSAKGAMRFKVDTTISSIKIVRNGISFSANSSRFPFSRIRSAVLPTVIVPLTSSSKILSILYHSSRDPFSLEGMDCLLGLLLQGPCLDQGIQLRAVLQRCQNGQRPKQTPAAISPSAKPGPTGSLSS